MKKVFFSVLMISAMFVLASCGSKSNSGEAAAEATEEEVAKVEFADPAIVYGEGVDLTSYFSPVSVSQPTIYEDKSSGNYRYRFSVNVKLKVEKKINLVSNDERAKEWPSLYSPTCRFTINFCDQNGSKIASGSIDKAPDSLPEGSTISLDILSKEEDFVLNDMEKKLATLKNIEVKITTFYAGLASNEE